MLCPARTFVLTCNGFLLRFSVNIFVAIVNHKPYNLFGADALHLCQAMKHKPAVKKRRDDVERATATLRLLPKKDWQRIKALAKQNGLNLWMVFDEMFHDWLKKHDR